MRKSKELQELEVDVEMADFSQTATSRDGE